MEPLVEFRQRCPHADPELGVEVRQRFVHEERLRLPHDRPAHRHALALAAGQRGGLAREVRLQAEDLGRILDAAGDLALGCLAHLQAESHVLGHGHLRVKGIVLEDHRDVAVLGRQVVHDLVADLDGPAGDVFQSGDNPQGGRFPAPGRADQDHELAVRDLQAEVVHRLDAAGKYLVDLIEHDLCHFIAPYVRLAQLSCAQDGSWV
jgi:hypothetical protein